MKRHPSGQSPIDKPLWRCPECGHRFVSRNLWHSCGRHPIAAHFAGRPPGLLRTYRAYAALARACGPVTIYAQKTRIVFQTKVRFAGVIVHSQWVEGTMWLTSRHDHPALRKVMIFPPHAMVHHFTLTTPADVDARLGELMRDAYELGLRHHLQGEEP